MNEDTQLSPQETAMFQALVKPGAVYLLMLRLDRPTGAREVADILGIHEQTAARYLRALARLNLVARVGPKQGYVLLGGSQLVLGELPDSLGLSEPDEDSEPEQPGQIEDTTKISQYPATTIKLINNINDSEEVVVDSGTSKISQYRRPQSGGRAQLLGRGFAPTELLRGPDFFGRDPPLSHTTNISQDEDTDKLAEVWCELSAAGIGRNPRTQALVRLPHVTPEYVRAHRLRLAERGKSGPKWTGLLVTILEQGDPAPRLNPGGHLASCKCPDCHRHGIAESWG